MGKKIDLTNITFGRLTVVEEVTPSISPSGYKSVRWLCTCSCGSGKEVLVTTAHLRSGNTKSCGCLHKEKVSNHNKSGTPEHNTWRNIKARCYNKNNEDYPDYGGRGIKMCSRWLDSFENFFEDMGPRPSNKHSIERIDVNEGYSCVNCKWIENKNQARNKRKRKDNVSGKTGVRKHSVKGNDYWRVVWYDSDTDKMQNKYFSIKKYGEEEEAFRLACEYRDAMINEMNEKGAEYGENHGK